MLGSAGALAMIRKLKPAALVAAGCSAYLSLALQGKEKGGLEG